MTTLIAQPKAQSLRNPYWESFRKITREQSNALNALAEELAFELQAYAGGDMLRGACRLSFHHFIHFHSLIGTNPQQIKALW